MKIYLKTYGCTLNRADSDLMRGILKKSNYEITDCEDKSDLVILNTCTVKGATENKIIERIKKIGDKKKLVIAGCLSINENKLRKINPKIVVVYPNAVSNIVKAVEDSLNGRNRTYTTGEDKSYLENQITTPIMRVAIQEGCVGNCYFCQTKLARPKLISYNENRIIDRINKGVTNGAKEVEITGMDSGAYGLDRNSNLIELLKKIEKIEGEFKVRIGMINPIHVKRMKNELIRILSGEKFYKFIHLPVQTGSEKVCKSMNRPHTVIDFINQVREFRKKIPNITIATDIIIGYPTESESDFEDTVDLINKTRPDVVNLSKFTPRDRTKAKNMKQLDSKITSRRSIAITKLIHKIGNENNTRCIGMEYEVLITEKQRDWTGRNENYKTVVVKDFKGKLGDKTKVKITDSNYGSLFGKII